MSHLATRRTVLAGAASLGTAGLAGCFDGGDEGPEPTTYQLWALDQGTDTIYVYERDHRVEDPAEAFSAVETIDLGELEAVSASRATPHSVAFSSDHTYAVVACPGSGQTLVFRTDGYELVDTVSTGSGTRAATFTPDDEAVLVDVTGQRTVVRIAVDRDADSFTVADRLSLQYDGTVRDAGLTDAAPVCHGFDDRGRSLHVLGPSHDAAGLVVIDRSTFSVERAYGPEDLPVNGRLAVHPDEDAVYLTGGRPSDGDGADGVGRFAVYDPASDVVTTAPTSTDGVDARAVAFTSDEDELWVLNRETNGGVVVDPETDRIVDPLGPIGPADGSAPADRDAPERLRMSPDGQYAFVTLRGPDPRTGPSRAATGVTPGVAVLSVTTREIETVIEPDPIGEYAQSAIDGDGAPTPDFHGLGIRPLAPGIGSSTPL